MKNALVLSLVLAMPTAAAAQSEGFVIRLGTDTIAIENFVRSAARLDGELSGSAVQVRHRYTVELDSGQVVSMQSDVIPTGGDTATLRASLQFARDSVFVTMTRAGMPQPAQRLVTQRGAVPFINLAFSLVELITTRARRTPGDSISAPLFLLSNGGTMAAKVKWIAPDSALMSLAGVELRMHLDGRGRILHATVPSQNVTIERVAGTLNRSQAPPPDYSAPAGAR